MKKSKLVLIGIILFLLAFGVFFVVGQSASNSKQPQRTPVPTTEPTAEPMATPTENTDNADVTITALPTKCEMTVGYGYPITVTTAGTSEPITYTISDSSLADVVLTNSGKYGINGKKAGTGTVTFSVGDKSTTVDFTVKPTSASSPQTPAQPQTNTQPSTGSGTPYNGQTKVENGITYKYNAVFNQWVEVQSGGGVEQGAPNMGTGDIVMQ